MENGRNGRYTAADFIEVIPGSAGIISTIAKRVGCAWHTAKGYITKYPTVARAYDDECAAVVDMAESIIVKAMQDEDVPTAKWFLAMKGQERGYIQMQRQVLSGPNEGPIEITDHRTELERRLLGIIANTEASEVSEDT